MCVIFPVAGVGGASDKHLNAILCKSFIFGSHCQSGKRRTTQTREQTENQTANKASATRTQKAGDGGSDASPLFGKIE